jgi:uncharacterized protein
VLGRVEVGVTPRRFTLSLPSKKHSVAAAAKRAVTQDSKMRDKAATADSFQNFAAGLGLGVNQQASAAGYGYNPITRIRTLLEWIHRGSWLGGVAIDVVGDDMTRMGVELRGDLDPEDIEHLDRAATSWSIWQAINDTIKWSRLYGGCLAYMWIDGQKSDTPLRLDTVGRNQFKGLLVLDRWMVEPTLNDLITDPGPDMGLPKYYISTADAPIKQGMKIHHSRCLRLEGIRLPWWQRISENMWGISVLERLYDRMVAFDSATTGAAQMVYKCYLRTYKIAGLREIVAAGGDGLNGLIKFVDNMRRFQSNEGITLIDGEDDFSTLQYSFSGLSDVILQFGQQLSGALQIPLVRLFGQSPAGLNSTGESDLRMYYDGIKQQQEARLRVPVTRIYRALAASEGVKLPEGFSIDFRPLWQLTDVEKVAVAGNLTTQVMQAFESGIVDRATAMKELRQGSKLTGVWTNIGDEEIDSAEGEPPPGSLEATQQSLELQQAYAPEPEEGKKSGVTDAVVNAFRRKSRRFVKDSMLGDVKVAGFDVVIEHDSGEIRYGRKLPAQYGFIRRTDSAEPGDQMDCFVGNQKDSGKVFIIDSFTDNGTFDEHKVIFWVADKEAACKLFRDYYYERRSLCVEVAPVLLAEWLEKGDVRQPYTQVTDSEYTPTSSNPETVCDKCRYFQKGICLNSLVQRDPKVPEVWGLGLKQVQPSGWCKQFEGEKQ